METACSSFEAKFNHSAAFVVVGQANHTVLTYHLSTCTASSSGMALSTSLCMHPCFGDRTIASAADR